MKYLFYFFSSFLFVQINAQNTIEKQKVLFVLDASGSMTTAWGEDNKMEIARTTLNFLVDSIEKTNPNVEMALRVFGHQYHKSLDICEDSKLEIPFGPSNSAVFKEKLKEIQPNGNTPIAYSLMESAQDFNDEEAINSIILITDGLENCEGNPCEAAKFLSERRITINPFIIGLDIQDSLISDFDCIGSFINAKDEESLKTILKSTVKKATGVTSLCIDLRSEKNQEITNTPISILDAVTNKTLYTYIHSISKKGLPDTLFIDPRGVYSLQVHSYPPVKSNSFELKPGEHNNVQMSLPKSYLDFNHKKLYDESSARILLRAVDEWVYNFNMQDLPLLAGSYSLTTTLLPLNHQVLELTSDEVYLQNYPSNGKLSIENKSATLASIYKVGSHKWDFVFDIGKIMGDYTIKLQPGKYSLLYISDSETDSEQTHRYDFEINEERTTVIQIK